MLVIVSDLHLTDVSLGLSPSAEAFQFFSARLAEMAAKASLRADGSYRPIEAIDLVLLGDVLNLIRSDLWLPSDARPWDDPHAPEVSHLVARIIGRILEEHAPALAVLRDMAAGTAISIPLDLESAARSDAARRQLVPVRIHYMAGDHDWPLHLPGERYDRLRSLVVERLGLANAADLPFPHDPGESGPLLEVLRRHRVIARHGDIFDPIHFDEDRNASSLGDAIAIELLARFQAEIRSGLADQLPAATLNSLGELDNVQPVLSAPVWIEAVLNGTCQSPAACNHVKLLWDRLVDRFLQLKFVRSRDAWDPVDLIDGLAGILKFNRRTSTDRARSAAYSFSALHGAADSSYSRHALAEQDIRNRRARFVVYGHTHQAECVPLETTGDINRDLDQVYFNAGARRRVNRPTQVSLGAQEFMPTHAMNYLAFYQGDERSGCPYDLWSADCPSSRLQSRSAA